MIRPESRDGFNQYLDAGSLARRSRCPVFFCHSYNGLEMMLDSGHEVTSLKEEELTKMRNHFGNYVDEGMVRLMPGRWLLPKKFLKFANKIYNFEMRQTDVIVNTYSKCGTTWIQEIVWTMRHNPNLNNPEASKPNLRRSPFLEFDMLMSDFDAKSPPPDNPFIKAFMEVCPDKDIEDGVTFQLAEAIPDPRTIKTHLPLSLLPPSLLDNAKVIYVARNPKDVVVSYHHHHKIMEVLDFVGTFDDFVQYFVDDDVLYGPYWLHLKEAWEKRNHPNLLIIFYEDLKENPLEEIRKIDAFLGTNLTEAQMEGVVEYTSFGKMKTRGEWRKPTGNEDAPEKGSQELEAYERRKRKQEYVKQEGGFYRKGVVGDWQNRMTTDQDAKVNKWIEDKISSFGLRFKYAI